MTELALFSVAKEALAEARRTDEVKGIRDEAVRMRLYGEQAKDRTIIADAQEIISRAERKLGELIQSAKEVGQLGVGRPSRSNVEGVEETDDDGDDDNGRPPRPFSRVTLQEAGISKDLSARSQKMASLDETAFEAAMQAARDKIISGGAAAVNPLKDVSTAGKKAARAAREQQLGALQIALPEAKFGVILADPEWQFETFSSAGMDRSADNHYPTSPLETIKRRDVGSLAAGDSVCWLWCTVPMLLEGIAVLQAWGFTYKSHVVWNKDRIGTGYWFRNKHELLLVGTRGNVPAPAMGDQFPSVIDAPVGEHSAKPEKFYEIIEAYYPTLPKIELNARQARNGWVRWGYEAPADTPLPSEGHEGEEGQERIPEIESRSEGSASPLQRSSGVHAAPPDSLQAEPEISSQAGEPLSTEAADAIIRAGDDDRIPLAELAERIGRPGNINYVKNRRRVMKLSSVDRIRESVALSNKRRAAE